MSLPLPLPVPESLPLYLQPIAQHLAYPERFLLRDEDDRWYVWKAAAADERPEEIAPATAFWLLDKAWIAPLATESAWVHVDDLPLAPSLGSPYPRS